MMYYYRGRKDSLLNCFLIIAAVLFTGLSNLKANDYLPLNILKCDIANQTHLLHLQEKTDYNAFIQKESFEEGYFSFPFTSYSKFKESLTDFLFSKEKKHSFLEYQVVDDNISGRLQINLIGGIDYHSSSDNQYLHPYRRVQVSGNIYNRLAFWGDWWAGRFQGDLDYAEETNPLIRGWHKSHTLDGQTYTNLNRLSGQISYLFGFGNISIGRDRHQIGNSISGSIILNDNTNEYGYFSSEIIFGKLKLSFLHASLLPKNIDPIYSDSYGIRYVDKYLIMHHLSYQPYTNFEVFFGEMIVYGNRNPEINYLLPHTFYRITEHNLRDRDNVLIYGGGIWDVTKGISLYGSLILDELKKSEIFGDWWGNKYAVQGGIAASYLQGFFHHKNDKFQTNLEFTAVRPWMYTHKTTHTDYSHDGFGLGFTEGSNLIQGAVEIKLPLLPYLSFNNFISLTRQGSWGNCWCLNYDDDRKVDGVFKDSAKWLEGDITETLRVKGVFTLSPLAHHSLKAGMEWIQETEESSNVINSRQELVISYQFSY